MFPFSQRTSGLLFLLAALLSAVLSLTIYGVAFLGLSVVMGLAGVSLLVRKR